LLLEDGPRSNRRPGTYTKLKEIITGKIPGPFPEPSLADANPGKISFEHFEDDDMGGSTFEDLLHFLHHYYFPRVGWARPTMNPEKSRFFVSELRVPGFGKSPKGLRSPADKLRVF